MLFLDSEIPDFHLIYTDSKKYSIKKRDRAASF